MAGTSAIQVVGVRELIAKTAALSQQAALTRPIRAAGRVAAEQVRDDVSARIAAVIARPHPRFLHPFTVRELRGEEPGWVAETNPVAGALLDRLRKGQGPQSRRGLYVAPSAQDPYGNLRPGGVAALLSAPGRFRVTGRRGRLSPGVWERTPQGLRPIVVEAKPAKWTKRKLDIQPDIRNAQRTYLLQARYGFAALLR